MASRYQIPMLHKQQQVSTNTMLLATVAGITIAGPLLAFMGFIYIATVTVFVVSSPLLIFLSPVLLGVGFLLLAAFVGFGAQCKIATAGLSALSQVFQSVKGGQLQQSLESATGKLKKRVKDTRSLWASDLKQAVESVPEDEMATGD